FVMAYYRAAATEDGHAKAGHGGYGAMIGAAAPAPMPRPALNPMNRPIGQPLGSPMMMANGGIRRF
ncbi:MAG TPA: hypothetical protein VMV79_00540, partial [Alphaproteobacteria bacterium]|nr:hypothetical protein [Alphaproteobacteria bacterium]